MTTELIAFNSSSSTASVTRGIIELNGLKCRWKGNFKEKGKDETPKPQHRTVF